MKNRTINKPGRLPTLNKFLGSKSYKLSLFLLTSSVSLLLTVNARNFLPERFLRDNNYINLRIDTKISFWNDSFELPVSIYSFFRLASTNDDLLVSLFSWTVGFIPYYLIHKIYKEMNPIFSLVFYTGILLLPFYYFGYTKEVVSSLVCLTLVIISRYLGTRSANLYLFFVFTILGTIFRAYWILLSASFLALTLTAKFHQRFPKFMRIISIPIASILLVLICQLFGITEVNRARLNPQQSFSDVATNSLLPGIDLSGGFVILIQNIFEVFLGLLFPFLIYQNFNIYSVFAIFVCCLLSISTLIATNNLNHGKELNKYHYFPASLMIVQLIFEPDLGSYVRHVAPFIPILLMQLLSRNH